MRPARRWSVRCHAASAQTHARNAETKQAESARFRNGSNQKLPLVIETPAYRARGFPPRHPQPLWGADVVQAARRGESIKRLKVLLTADQHVQDRATRIPVSGERRHV